MVKLGDLAIPGRLVRGVVAKGLEVVVTHDGDGREARGHAEPEGQAGKRT